MKYMLLTYLDENRWHALSEQDQQRAMGECVPHLQNLLAAGKFLGGSPLEATSSARTVKLHSGKKLVLDGPYAETKEQLGGYSLIEAADLDEATEIAGGFLGKSIPVIIEIRQIVPYEVPTH
jgi:hypothetical protein